MTIADDTLIWQNISFDEKMFCQIIDLWKIENFWDCRWHFNFPKINNDNSIFFDFETLPWNNQRGHFFEDFKFFDIQSHLLSLLCFQFKVIKRRYVFWAHYIFFCETKAVENGHHFFVKPLKSQPFTQWHLFQFTIEFFAQMD